ncbi:MAG TPA: hypothetical protein VI756_17760 [Blastocatellia bacterium]
MTKNFKIHAFWIIGDLVAIIIYLLVKRFGDNGNVVTYVSFASTMASLILAVVAILYAFISNASLSQNITAINNAASDVSAQAKQLSEASTELTGKIEGIPPSIKSVETKVDLLVRSRIPESKAFDLIGARSGKLIGLARREVVSRVSQILDQRSFSGPAVDEIVETVNNVLGRLEHELPEYTRRDYVADRLNGATVLGFKGTVGDLADSLEFDENAIADAVWELAREGEIRLPSRIREQVRSNPFH